jgi:hypothetical protein
MDVLTPQQIQNTETNTSQQTFQNDTQIINLCLIIQKQQSLLSKFLDNSSQKEVIEQDIHISQGVYYNKLIILFEILFQNNKLNFQNFF